MVGCLIIRSVTYLEHFVIEVALIARVTLRFVTKVLEVAMRVAVTKVLELEDLIF